MVIDEKSPKSEFGVTKPKLEPLSLEQESTLKNSEISTDREFVPNPDLR